jgi:hypothetical protein
MELTGLLDTTVMTYSKTRRSAVYIVSLVDNIISLVQSGVDIKCQLLLITR